MSDAYAPTDYISYLKKKIEFLERQVVEVVDRFNPGGTIVCYPDWVSEYPHGDHDSGSEALGRALLKGIKDRRARIELLEGIADLADSKNQLEDRIKSYELMKKMQGLSKDQNAKYILASHAYTTADHYLRAAIEKRKGEM